MGSHRVRGEPRVLFCEIGRHELGLLEHLVFGQDKLAIKLLIFARGLLFIKVLLLLTLVRMQQRIFHL